MNSAYSDSTNIFTLRSHISNRDHYYHIILILSTLYTYIHFKYVRKKKMKPIHPTRSIHNVYGCIYIEINSQQNRAFVFRLSLMRVRVRGIARASSPRALHVHHIYSPHMCGTLKLTRFYCLHYIEIELSIRAREKSICSCAQNFWFGGAREKHFLAKCFFGFFFGSRVKRRKGIKLHHEFLYGYNGVLNEVQKR